MAHRVLIPLPGVGTLALDEEAYRRALEEGARLNRSPSIRNISAGLSARLSRRSLICSWMTAAPAIAA
jgi:hypothetical protein